MANIQKKKIVVGIGWQSAATIVQAIIQVISISVLARHLDRQDFGIVAVANILLNFLQLFVAAGVGPGLVQKDHIDRSTLSAACWLSVIIGVGLSICSVMLAEPFCRYMNADVAEPILRVLSVSFLINSIAAVPQAVLQRQFNFRYLSMVTSASWIAGYGICGIYSAVIGLGVWAIVIGSTSTNVFLLIGYLFKVNTSWSLSGIHTSIRWLLDFGASLSLVKFFNVVILHVDRFVVGKRFGVDDLGKYSLPAQLVQIPTRYVGDILDKVMYPALARAQFDSEKLQRQFLGSTFVSMFVVVPCSFVLLLYSPLLILVFLGEQWLDTSLLLRILSFGMIFKALIRMVDILSRAHNKQYSNAFVKALSALIMLLCALIGSLWGLHGVAIGVQVGLLSYAVLSTRLMFQITLLRRQDIAEILRPIGFFVIFLLIISSMEKAVVPDNIHVAARLLSMTLVVSISFVATYVICKPFFHRYIKYVRPSRPANGKNR